MYLYKELKKCNFIKVIYVTYKKSELKRLRARNVNVYYSKDPRNFLLFLRTKIWVSGNGPRLIPFEKTQIFFNKFFNIKISKWVSLYHGLIFKRLPIEKMLINFDLAFVTSNFFKNFYSKESGSQEKFRITGYPRTDPLVNRKWDKKEILKELGLPSAKKNILYAPTYGIYYEDFLFTNVKKNIEDIEKFCNINNSNFLIRMHHSWFGKNPEKSKILKNKIR